MAAAHLRRSVATAAIAAVTTVVAPLAVSLLAPTTALAASAPAMDETKSAPEQGGALYGVGGALTAVFDQAITGNQGNTGSSTCGDPTKCAFVLYEINADGSRGLRLPGTVTFAKSGTNPVTAIQDTVKFQPQFNLTSGGTYEALVNVQSADKSTTTNLDYKIYASTVAPSKLSAPATATTGNNKAFPLSGYAPPGMTVNVTVVNPKSPNPGGQLNATGSVVVDPCSAISCPWTATVDISNGNEWSSPQTGVDWTASVTDANGNPSSNDSNNTAEANAQTPKATFSIDYSPPAMPTATIAITNNSTTHTSYVTVSATDTDSSTTSYVVTATDAASNVVTHTYPAQGTNLPSTQMDISALDDGSIHVVVQAQDNVGNVSAECDSNPPPVQKCSSADVTKTAGLMTSLPTSMITSASGDTTFTNAQSQAVQTPTKITVGFTQTIKESHTNCCTQSGSQTSHSSLCIATPNGNCIASGGTPTVASDNRSITFPISAKLADGKYEVSVTTYSASNCPDITPQNAASPPSCESFSDFVRVPGTGTPASPFQFTVDSTPPTVAIGTVTNPIMASNDKSVTATGSVSNDASTVQLLYTSAGTQPTKLLVNATITPPPSGSTTATWSGGPSDLSSFPDGQVTLKVTAKNSSGLAGTATKTLTMQAHLSTLSEFTDHTVITANSAIHISGHLSDQSGNPVADATISVRPRFTNGKLGNAATVVTNSSGAYSATFVPQFSARYVATYAGSPQHDGVTANTAKTSVRAAVSLSGKAKQGSSVTVTGHVSPSKAGKTVTIYKKTASGWAVAGKAKLNGQSAFTVHLSLAHGKNRLYAAIGATSGNLAGKSGVLVITVG